MKVSAQYAETHLADLFIAASQGEEVEIELPEKPALLLVSKRAEQSPIHHSNRKGWLGVWEGLIELPTDEEWNAMDREIETEMNGETFEFMDQP